MKNTMNALWSPRLVALSFSVLMLVLGCNSPTGPGGGSMPPDAGLLPIPGTPQILGINTDTNGNSTLSWSSVTGAETYKAYYSGSETGDYTAISNLTDTSYILPFYGWYKVSAANETGEGALSNAVERKEPVSMNGPVATPTLSIAPGSFDETTNVELSCTTPDALIYYTTDGSTPIVGTSSQYVAAITVLPGETITITAIAAATDYSNSDAVSGTYHVRSWEVVGSAGFSGGEVWYVSLSIDGNGHPWIAYMDASTTPQYKATVMRFDGNSWVAHGGKGISTGVASDTLIAIDSANNVYVAYKDYSSIPTSGMATVLRYNGLAWATLGAAGFSASTFIFPSIAVYDSGDVHTPFVAYKDSGNSNKATVRSFNGVSWPVLGVAGISAGNILGTSLAISEDGVPYLAYVDEFHGNKATVQVYDGSWSSVGTEGFSPAAVDSVSLAVSGSGASRKLYVGFKDASVSDKATIMSFDGGLWSPVGAAGVSSGTANLVTVSLAPNGTPFIAYIDGNAGTGRVEVRKFDGNGWILVGASGFSPGGAAYLNLVIDSQGHPIVAFKDGNEAGKATVMAFR